MAEIATLTAVFTADLSQFEIGVASATSLMTNASAKIGADLSAIASASIGMSGVMIGNLNAISTAINALMGQIIALKNAMNSIGGVGGSAMSNQMTGSASTTITGGTFVFEGVQDVNGLYDALSDVARQRSPL